MADLDDFFAKKDRKRAVKQGRKYNTPDELARRLEEPRKPKPEAKPQIAGAPGDPAQPPQQEGDAPPHHAPVQEEDEWREVEVAKKADYTGLKIQHLTPGQENPQQTDGNMTGNYNLGNADFRPKGPWNKTPEVSEPVREERELPAPSDVILPPPPSSSSSSSKTYISPAMRNRSATYFDPPVRRFGKPLAPDINNQDFFPSLGEGRRSHGGERGGGGGAWSEASRGGSWSEANRGGSWSEANRGGSWSEANRGGSWSEANRGGSWSEANRGAPPSARLPPREVSLGNRYNSLTNDS